MKSVRQVERVALIKFLLYHPLQVFSQGQDERRCPYLTNCVNVNCYIASDLNSDLSFFSFSITHHPLQVISQGHLFSSYAIIFIAGGSSGVQRRMGHFVTFLLLEQISAILLLLFAMQVILAILQCTMQIFALLQSSI